jgi:undecaprenyl diphosphate synthase
MTSPLVSTAVRCIAPLSERRPGMHVAIISDGNGRWATSRGLPRTAGHRAGAAAARRIIEAAPDLGIQTLTLFALSSANWKRPAPEVAAILKLLHEYLLLEIHHCLEEGIRLTIIGRRDRLPAAFAGNHQKG